MTKTYRAYKYVPEISSTEYAGDLTVKMYLTDQEILRKAQIVFGDSLSHVRLGHHTIYAPEQEQSYAIPASQPYPYPTGHISSGSGEWVITLLLFLLVAVVVFGILWFGYTVISWRLETLGVVAQQSVHLTRAGVGNL